MSRDMYEVILKDCNNEELHVETMDISGKTVEDLLEEMLELWRENQDTCDFSIEVTKVKK